MVPMVMDGAMGLIGSLWDGATDKWREGLVPFMTSPYGIFLMFVALFLFLNSMRTRL